MNFMEHYGYLGTFLMIFFENIFPPIPSEVILTFGGFMTTNTNMTIIGVIISATAGSVAGAAMLYWIGHLFDVKKLEKIIDKWGYLLRLKTSDIHKANSWFNRYGYRAIFFCRMVPLIRSLISIPAGMANMKFSVFLIYTTAGTLLWNMILVCTGAALGESWEKILDFMDVYSSITYGILALIMGIFVLLWFFKRRYKVKVK